MRGSRMYCRICGGPTCSVFFDNDDLAVGGDDFHASFDQFPGVGPSVASFEQLPGVTPSDARWICASVAVYADCITLPGEYDRNAFRVRVFGQWEEQDEQDNKKGEKSEEGKESEDGDEKEQSGPADSAQRPAWAKEGLPGHGKYNVSGDRCFLAHDLCVRLAAVWSKAENPNPKRFPVEARADPARFFWDFGGPVAQFLCDGTVTKRDERTQAFFAESTLKKQELGAIKHLDLRRFLRNFNQGYTEEECATAGAWLAYRGSDEYKHLESFGITHLKRPDHFPDVHPLPTAAFHGADSSSLFPAAHVPFDIIMTIVSCWDDLDSYYVLSGPDIRALECVSRSWRDLFRSSVMQRLLWLKRAREWNFLPDAEADWTRSARRVLDASTNLNEVFDWRRYYNDSRKSLNLENRSRIRQAVRELDHEMDNCGCGSLMAAEETDGHEEGEGTDDT